MIGACKIIHIDMDAFFASVEQRENSAWQGKPVIVGGLPHERGVVCSASYEARKFGVRSAMPSSRALRLCPQAIFVRPHFSLYKEASQHVMQIFSRYSELIEPLSLDEAFLDVSENLSPYQGSATYAALDILKHIQKETELTASAGISCGKFFAKIASDIKKPKGHFVLPPTDIEKFLDNLAVEKFYGIGKVTAERLKQLGIFNGKHLRLLSFQQLKVLFGSSAIFYQRILQGEDSRPVLSYQQATEEQKSLGAEKTFSQDIDNFFDLDKKLAEICERVFSRLLQKQKWGITLSVKLKLADFRVFSRAQSSSIRFSSLPQFYSAAKKILWPLYREVSWEPRVPVRLLGVTVSNISPRGLDKDQLLFDFS